MKKTILLFTYFSFALSFTLYAGTLKGIHDTIGGPQSSGLENLNKMGKMPDVFSSDFGFSTHPNDDYRKRPILLDKFISLSAKMKIMTLSYHQCRPDIQEPCTFNTGVANVDFTDAQWKELLTLNSPLNKQWQKQINNLGDFLTKLQNKNITIYLRPYHESNIPSFWWADIKNPKHSIDLWKMLHTYLTENYKLKNIKWVWALSYHTKYLTNLNSLYPGDEWVDVLGFDIYPTHANEFPEIKKAWDLLEHISLKKPKALTEVSRLPSLKDLAQNNWLYVVPWGENMLKKENTPEEIKAFY
ncbi:MAG: glycosyl hydrolase [Bacteriovorax sp.]|nr:glycosyl hydrolase [Bacteriovorax sp.]